MFYEQIKNLNNEDFVRITGIDRSTFDKMVEDLRKIDQKQKYYGGRKNVYSIENRVTMTLKYWKEYPTFFQMSQVYGLSPSSCYRNIVWVEDNLADLPDFQMPTKDEILNEDCKNDTLIIDATDVPIERPQKKRTNRILFRQK